MATRVSVTGGNWSDATTWQTITASSSIGTGNASVSTTKRYGQVFTAPDTSSSVLGCIMYWANVSVNKTKFLTIALQEYNGSSWIDKATKTIDETYIKYDNMSKTGTGVSSFIYFKFDTPYTFTTTTAGYYRFSFIGGTDTVSIRYDTVSSSTIWYMCIDDRTSAVGGTDDIMIIGDPTTGFSTLIIDGNLTCGAGNNLTAVPNTTQTNNAVMIGHSGRIQASTTASTSLTFNGHFMGLNGGSYLAGTINTPLNASYTHELIPKGQTTLSQNSMIYFYNYRTDENYVFSGTPTTQIGWYSSGSGTTASPLITTTAVDWNVGDEIVITGSAYNTWEIKYIITKNSSSSFVLSSSRGGGEAGYSNTHYTTDFIQNITHNVKIRSDDQTKPFAGGSYAYSANGVRFKNCEIRDAGGDTSGRYNFILGSSARYSVSIENCSLVPADVSYAGIYSYSSANANSKIDGLVGYLRTTSTNSIGILYLANYKGTYQNIYLIGGYSRQATYSGKVTYSNIYSYNGQRRTATGSYNYYPLGLNGSNCVYNNINVQASRDVSVYVAGTNNVCKNSHFGDVYSNNRDINVGYIATTPQIVFDNCKFGTWGTANLWSSPIDSETNSIYMCSAGSYVIFTNIDGNLDDSQGFYPEGQIDSTGAGLTDTTIRTTGGFPMRFRPQYGDITLPVIQTIPTGNIQNKTMIVGVWIKINNANYWGGTYSMPRLTIEYDNGTIVYKDALQVAGEWQFVYLPFTPTTAYGVVSVTLECASDATTTDAYVYVTDWSVFYPAGVQLDLGKQAVWVKGLPVFPTIATNLSVNDVWTVPTSTLTGTGTVGKLVNELPIQIDSAGLTKAIF